MEETYYSILGIAETADQTEIKAAFKKLAKQYHPDKHSGSIFHEEYFKKINLAYSELSDADSRFRYDAKLYSQRLSQRNSTSTDTSNYKQNKPSGKAKKGAKKDKTLWWVSGFFLVAFILGTLAYYWINNYSARKAFTMGLAYMKSAKYQEAKLAFEEALLIDDTYPEAYEKLGDCYLALYKDAIRASYCFTNAISNFKTPAYSLYLKRAKCYTKMGKTDLASQDYAKVLILKPDYDSVYLFRANAYIEAGKYPNAIEDFTKYLTLHPNDFGTQIGLGDALLENENSNEALGLYQTMESLNPYLGEINVHKAFALVDLGDTLKACNELKMARAKGFTGANELEKLWCSTP